MADLFGERVNLAGDLIDPCVEIVGQRVDFAVERINRLGQLFARADREVLVSRVLRRIIDLRETVEEIGEFRRNVRFAERIEKHFQVTVGGLFDFGTGTVAASAA